MKREKGVRGWDILSARTSYLMIGYTSRHARPGILDLTLWRKKRQTGIEDIGKGLYSRRIRAAGYELKWQRDESGEGFQPGRE